MMANPATLQAAKAAPVPAIAEKEPARTPKSKEKHSKESGRTKSIANMLAP
jgi:hypothetical protein